MPARKTAAPTTPAAPETTPAAPEAPAPVAPATPGVPTVYEAWARVMADVRSVAKTDINTEQGFRFRGIDAVVNAVGPALRTHGVLVLPVNVVTNYRDVTTSRGKAARECTVMVTYRVVGPAGDGFEIVAPGEALDMGDKGTAKAMSVALRTALLQALCLPTDERDPDHDVYERVPEAVAVQAHQAAQQQTEALRQKAKRRVWEVAQQLGMSGEDVTHDYAYRMGQAIDTANAKDLYAYADQLRQTLREQRKGQAGATGDSPTAPPVAAPQDVAAAVADIEAMPDGQ